MATCMDMDAEAAMGRTTKIMVSAMSLSSTAISTLDSAGFEAAGAAASGYPRSLESEGNVKKGRGGGDQITLEILV